MTQERRSCLVAALRSANERSPLGHCTCRTRHCTKIAPWSATSRTSREWIDRQRALLVSRRRDAGWNRFWFQPADPATLGLIRILAGAMLLYTHLVWSLDLASVLWSDGWLSPEAVHLRAEGLVHLELLLVDRVAVRCCGPCTSPRWSCSRC